MPPTGHSDNTTRLIRRVEARWNKALARVGEIEAKIAKHRTVAPQPIPMSASQLVALARNLRAIWTAPSTDARLMKRIVRTPIHEVLADLDDVASEIVLVIHCVGGVHTELRLPKRRRGQRNATPDDIVEAVRQLVLIANDDVIAGVLNRNRNGPTTGNGNRWTRERVTARRSYRRIPVFRPQIDGFEPWLNLGGAAKLLGVTPKTLRLAAEAGEIEGTHPLPEDPWIFSRSKLASPEARQILDRARQNPRHPIGSPPNQQSLFPSIT